MRYPEVNAYKIQFYSKNITSFPHYAAQQNSTSEKITVITFCCKFSARYNANIVLSLSV